MRWTDGEGRYQASNKIWKPKGNEGKWQRKGNMAVLHTVKKLPDWNNHPGVFCSMMSMCFCLGFKALCEGKSAATPCKLFSSSSFQPLCDLWSVLVRPQVHILPHTPAHPSDSPADSYAKFWFIITKDRIRAPSLHFLRTKFYGLKHKHRQVPCQFSHSSLHYL